MSINSVTQGTKMAPNSCMIFWAKARQLDRPSVLHTSTTITECILDHPFNGSQNPPLLPEQLSNIIVQHRWDPDFNPHLLTANGTAHIVAYSKS